MTVSPYHTGGAVHPREQHDIRWTGVSSHTVEGAWESVQMRWCDGRLPLLGG